MKVLWRTFGVAMALLTQLACNDDAAIGAGARLSLGLADGDDLFAQLDSARLDMRCDSNEAAVRLASSFDSATSSFTFAGLPRCSNAELTLWVYVRGDTPILALRGVANAVIEPPLVEVVMQTERYGEVAIAGLTAACELVVGDTVIAVASDSVVEVPAGDYQLRCPGLPAIAVVVEFGVRASVLVPAVPEPPDVNALLAELTTNPGVLEPGFDPAVNVYGAAVGFAGSMTIVARAESSLAHVAIADGEATLGSASADVVLPVGSTSITVTVTAESGATSSYLLLIQRDDPGDPATALLADLSVSPGALVPAFTPATKAYDVYLASYRTSLAVTPTAEADGAIVRISGADVAGGQPFTSGVVDGQTLTIAVTSFDGATTETYSVTIHVGLVTTLVSSPPIGTFVPTTRFYRAATTATTVTFSEVTTRGGATVTINGGAYSAAEPYALTVGLNPLFAKVAATGPGGEVEDYYFSATRDTYALRAALVLGPRSFFSHTTDAAGVLTGGTTSTAFPYDAFDFDVSQTNQYVFAPTDQGGFYPAVLCVQIASDGTFAGFVTSGVTAGSGGTDFTFDPLGTSAVFLQDATIVEGHNPSPSGMAFDTPFATPAAATTVVYHPSGKVVYAGIGASIYTYDLAGNELGRVTLASAVEDLAAHPNGRWVYASGESAITRLAVQRPSETLVAAESISGTPHELKIAANGGVAYLMAPDSVLTYEIDSDGQLSSIGFMTIANIVDIEPDSANAWLYVVTGGASPTLQQWAILADGTLDSAASASFPTATAAVEVNVLDLY